MKKKPEELLKELFMEAVKAADPESIIEPYIPDPPQGKTVVIGVGKRQQNWLVLWRGALKVL